LPLNAGLTILSKHLANLFEGKAGGTPQRDKCQLIQNDRIKKAPKPAPANRPDQPLILIKAQCGCGNARTFRDLGYVQIFHA